ncbi:hypothetical protein CDD81_4966 [Ophiocordyceps australis]|uniref:Distal membrane-arm assembly complex protein 1-like domain-containing protein n=1 Tax=Ophiocordyceps australis TaxID=1399860 RepID=A0A2C5YB35_9HYPO|nr:hypothetical protein CDD81_4966 [Ophiocordyceps australis]
MARDQITLQSLQKPEDLQGLLRHDGDESCLSCKIVGSGAFFALGIYSYVSGMSQLEKQRNVIAQSKSMFGIKSRKFGIVGISLGLAWMGLWRAFR